MNFHRYILLYLTESHWVSSLKSDCSNEGSQKRGEDDIPEALSLPDRGVKGNFRDCFSHFLRYRLDILRHNGATHVYICIHIYHEKPQRTNASLFLFLFSRGRMMELRRKEENLEKYHGREIKRNGRLCFSSPVLLHLRSGRRKRQMVQAAKRGPDARAEDEINRDGREGERDVFQSININHRANSSCFLLPVLNANSVCTRTVYR